MGIGTRAFALVTTAAVALAGAALPVQPAAADNRPELSSPAAVAECATNWRKVGSETFRGLDALARSQGVTSDGKGWIFSWQGGVTRTNDNYRVESVGTIPARVGLKGGVHIGGIDSYKGLIYAPIEDTGYGEEPAKINNPEYQKPYIALLDAHSMRPKGKNILLDKSMHVAGVPWVAINAATKEAYTAEWDMTRDRINVFDTQMRFKRFLSLAYPPSLGAGFRLDRIQGAKVLGNTLFAARDDDRKSVYSVDLTSGVVAKRFELNRPGDEIEGLTIRPTGDGALLHVLVNRDFGNYVNPETRRFARVELQHWAPLPGPGCTPYDNSLAGAADVANVLLYERLMADHMHQGHAVEAEFDSAARLPGHVVGTGGWGDSGLWTGVYLGGQAMRYQVAKKHEADTSLTDSERAFWVAQRGQAFARVREILKAEHIDINIAEDWTGELRIPPDVKLGDPTTEKHIANWGGGVIKGEKGMIQRSCTPVGLGRLGINDPTVYPDSPVDNNDNRVFQIKWTHGDGKTYNCETSPSRDTYAGLIFGLLTTFDLVGPDAPELRKQIRTDLLAMGNFLWKYKWTYPRPHGYVSASHDFNGFFSPLFVYTPEARLNVANAVRHVTRLGGSTADKLKWEAIWQEELRIQGAGLGPSLAFDTLQPHDSYYKWNLSHLNAFNLLRTTTGIERRIIARGIAAMDKTTNDDVNAHFEAMMFSATGEHHRLAQATQHLREWLQYRANIEAGPVDNRSKCGVSIRCVPEDYGELELNLANGGTVTYMPGTVTDLRANRPLPVAERTPTDFLWQRSPTQLQGSQAFTHRGPGIDFLTPYWMIRYFTEVAPPPLRPFPEWPGPATV